MPDIDRQMDSWLSQVKKLVPNQKEQERITEAGAQVLKNKLTATTKAKHYSSHKDEKYGHMADHVTFMNTDIDGEHDGSSVVGWDNPYHAMNARRLNDGTKFIKADHFVDDAVNSSKDEVFEAMQKAYKEGD